MSDQSSDSRSDQPTAEAELIGTSGPNGTYPPSDEAGDESAVATAVEDAVDVASADADEAVAADETIAAGESADSPDAILADATMADESGPSADDALAATDETTGNAEGVDPEDGSVFLGELVRAMRTAAVAERLRIGEETERRRQAQVDRVRARQAEEADRMRQLAADDMTAIDSWADVETKRIEAERESRATAVREDLETSLAEHAANIEREIEGIDATVAAYKAEIDTFFEELDQDTDPIVIAQRATMRPVFPILDAVEAAAEADAPAEAPAAAVSEGAPDAAVEESTEPAVVGVMDPDGADETAESWVASAEWSPEPSADAAASEPDAVGESVSGSPVADGTLEDAEPLAAVPATGHGGSSLFESVSVLRPMGWLRRDSNGADPSGREE
jgi:hypothetical protein